jgi:hypothetical protein
MFVDRRQPRWCHHSLFCIAILSMAIFYVGALAACGSQPPPDRPLTQNGTMHDDEAPTPAVVAKSKTIQPIEIVSGQTHLISYANGKMSLTITTSPYAICSFIVSYGMNTPSRSFGIKPVTADAHGVASWQWQVEGKAPVGIWPLQIIATSVNGAQTMQTSSATVTLPPIYLDSAKSVLNIARKARATLTVVTAPFVDCTMVMNYTSRTRTFKGTADAKGEISWTWNVEAGANPGSYPLIVTITTGSGEQARATFLMTTQ